MEKDPLGSLRIEDEGVHHGKLPAAQPASGIGDALLVTHDGLVQKLPIPSTDPNDPLNYSKWEKLGITVSCCWFSIMSLALAGGLGAILVTFFKLYGPEGRSTNEVVWLSTFPSLFIGIGNLIILPSALVFGRRPVFLTAIVGLLLSTIGAAVNKSYQSHLAARIIQGLMAGATESLLPLIITEISFVHERSSLFAAYWATQTAFSSALNLASSYETARLSWRWYYWVYAITVGVGLIMAFFLAFETRYSRPAMALDGRIIVTDEFGVTRTLEGAEASAYLAARDESINHHQPTQKKSYPEMLKPWSGVSKDPIMIVLKCWLNMVRSLSSPGILYSLLLSAVVLGCAIAISLTYNTVLEEDYGWPAENIGLINIGGVIGAFLGMLYAGWPADKVTIWLARRNGGMHKPEHRLVMLPIPGVIGFASMLLYGFTSSGNATWWGPYIGWTLYEYCFVAVLIITTAFAAESWPRDPGPAIVMVVGAKNIIAFGVSYGLIPMLARFGYPKALGILSGVFGAIFVLGIPTYYLNPIWRERVLKRVSKSTFDA